MTARVLVTDSLRTLIKIWGVGLIVLFSLVLAQTIMNTYGEKVDQAWAWLFAHVLPTLSLAIGAAVAEDKKRSRRTTSEFLASVSVWGSTVYLLVVLATLLVRPFTGVAPADWISKSGIWLSPLQAALVGCLGVFLTRTEA